ncbi:Holliday junction resolvase RuvX [Natranaerobius thermophilus]|uniref:Putative pre-16S rRNA nuclease n=1 Tax=Natranaerobius thermophilus (strain ATCC BAA-1301 / DSM 18059 / JW/NM-WN-LF) TaxID=457570 RepID=YQGF_NATTJ|nr:Holliday junction resolvase RuvX [Natranaerobius thermophilus]B2A5J5.1 RecName: Full=Putative pre-16S rRNA nuclease [Natranaerobius thermophilus JW/NM-WN-LF]ACB85350.1 Holliday junction resolvase YqgF [Natranaerobius thermophilus JW/NM-WN-LF]
MRIMGFDLGEATIGVAVSDALQLTAQGKTVIKRQSLEKDIEQVTKLIEDYQVSKLIVGLPKNMNGSLGQMADQIMDFIKSLEQEVDIPIETVDERLTSRMAEQTLLEADVSRKKRKQVIDKLAAVNILQTYLDRQVNKNNN